MGGSQTPPPDPDAELMLRVREGDEAAFRALFSRHAAALVAFVDRFFHNRAQSEEVVQEVFLKIYRARAGYQPRSKFTTWLYTIATRTSLNELRRAPPRPADLGPEEVAADTVGAIPSAEEALEGDRLQRLVGRILDGLPENQRAALMLVRFGGRSYAEVAGILHTTGSAVKSLVFRATEEVRRAIEAHQRGANTANALPSPATKDERK